MSNRRKPALRRALDAFFLGFGQAMNVSGSVVNRGRFAGGFAGDAKALAGDWQRSLSMADQHARTQRSAGVSAWSEQGGNPER